MSSFYRSINSILSILRKPSELILMNLLYSNCLPCLTYASDVVEFSCAEMRQCNVALNDAIRRIYSYNRWESTRMLRQQLGFQNVNKIFSKRVKISLIELLKVTTLLLLVWPIYHDYLCLMISLFIDKCS